MTAPDTGDVSDNPAASGLGRVGWAMFDWANQPFFTLITTFIFAPYFSAVVVGDPVRGQSLWGFSQAAAGLIIAFSSPVLGSIADVGGRRKPWIAAFVAVCAAGSVALWWVEPEMTTPLAWFLAALIIATVAIEFAVVFNNAMLPDLVPAARLGWWSGVGWGLGYLGGLAALFIVLLGFALPEVPLFGIDKLRHEHDRLVGPLTAVWLIVFVLPLFLFTPDRPRSPLPARRAIVRGLRALRETLRHVRDYRNIARYLIARMIYNDGILAVIGFSGIYAKGIFGWSTTELGMFAIVVTVIAAAGAFLGGYLDDRHGSKPTVFVSLGFLLVGTLGALSIEPGRLLFVISLPAAADTGFLARPEEWGFLAFAALIGLGFGPAQAASRTLMARMAPPSLRTEFFGLYALSGKATAFLAPFFIAIATDSFASQRAGLVVVVIFLALGALLLLGVKEVAAEEPL